LLETPAFWVNADETKMKDLAGFPIVLNLATDSVCNPIGKVFKRMTNGEGDSVEFFYTAFARVDATGHSPITMLVSADKKGFWSKLFGRRK
jgi:hypothetical protein